jgi:hypothetical protein
MQKIKMNLSVNADVARRFDELADSLESTGGQKKGVILAAAVRMFLDAPDDVKRLALQREFSSWMDEALPLKPGNPQGATIHTRLTESKPHRAGQPESNQGGAATPAERQPSRKLPTGR